MAYTEILKLTGAGNEARTRDLRLGKATLYQLSYSRAGSAILEESPTSVKPAWEPAVKPRYA